MSDKHFVNYRHKHDEAQLVLASMPDFEFFEKIKEALAYVCDENCGAFHSMDLLDELNERLRRLISNNL